MQCRSCLIVALMTLTLGTLAGCGDDESPSERSPAQERQSLDVTLKLAEGGSAGSASLAETEGGIEVRAHVRGLEPGFHGFHVHEKGLCEPPAFTSAGGHHKRAGEGHGAHAGDMPPLLATGDRKARASFVTDSFEIRELLAGDGSAIVIHAGRDNLANIPSRCKSLRAGKATA